MPERSPEAKARRAELYPADYSALMMKELTP